MNAGRTEGANDDAPFAEIDPRLNVFALANGMDISKGEGYRRLQWFSEERERAILIEVEDDDTYEIHILSWPADDPDDRKQSRLGNGLNVRDLFVALAGAIDAANGL